MDTTDALGANHLQVIATDAETGEVELSTVGMRAARTAGYGGPGVRVVPSEAQTGMFIRIGLAEAKQLREELGEAIRELEAAGWTAK